MVLANIKIKQLVVNAVFDGRAIGAATKLALYGAKRSSEVSKHVLSVPSFPSMMGQFEDAKIIPAGKFVD